MLGWAALWEYTGDNYCGSADKMQLAKVQRHNFFQKYVLNRSVKIRSLRLPVFPWDAIVFFLYFRSLLWNLHLNSTAYSKSTSQAISLTFLFNSKAKLPNINTEITEPYTKTNESSIRNGTTSGVKHGSYFAVGITITDIYGWKCTTESTGEF